MSSGFIRSDDKRYEELKSQMETSGLRYPEIPENALLISTSDEKVTKTFTGLLIDNSWSIRPLTTYL